jgi:hypothetical protein
LGLNKNYIEVIDDSSIAYGWVIFLFLSNILCSSGGVGGWSFNLCNLMGNLLATVASEYRDVMS